MLELRHLHAHNMRKEEPLKVCDIIATFDFNGLKFFNTGNKRKGDSCLSILPGDEEYSKKIRLSDVASRFHTVGSTKKNGKDHKDSKPKEYEEENSMRINSPSAIRNEESDKHFVIGYNSRDHTCMRYVTFKEKYERSTKSIVYYSQQLETQAYEATKTTQKYSQSCANTSADETINCRLKRNKVALKNGSGKCERGMLAKSKSSSNTDTKKQKAGKYIENQVKTVLEGHKCTPQSFKQEDVILLDDVDVNCAHGSFNGATSCTAVKECDENPAKVFAKLLKTPVVTIEHLFKCHICTDSFVSQNTLDMHLKYDHRPRPTCSQCLKMFDCRRKLINHEANCSSSDSATATQSLGGIIDFISPVEVFFCVKCENPFPSKDVLREHKILLNKRKPIVLELMEESTEKLPSTPHDNSKTSKTELWEICVKKMPSYSVRPVTQNDYNKCGYCGKAFQSLRRFDQHSVFCSRMKSIISQRECIYCKKSFRNRETRDQHACYCSKRTHGVSLVTNSDYQCQICNIVMKRLADYNLHLRLEHDQRYCCKCNEMYTPDTIEGRKHECALPMSQTKVKTPASRRVRAKKEKTISLTSTRQVRRKVNRFIKKQDNLYHPMDESNTLVSFNDKISTVKENIPMDVNKVNIGSNRRERPMDESNMLVSFNDKISTVKENIPVDVNKVNIDAKYTRRERAKQNKFRVSVTLHNPGTFHCVFCPDRSFSKRSYLDAHLRHRHNKTQCEFCGDIFRSHEYLLHDCLYRPPPSQEVNDGALKTSVASYLPSVKPGLNMTMPNPDLPDHDDKRFEDTDDIVDIESIDLDSSQLLTMSDKLPETPTLNYQCYKCAKTFSQRHFLIKHLVIHSKRNPYKCKYCRKLFKIPRHIDDHIRDFHYPHKYSHKKTVVESLTERHKIRRCHICLDFFLGAIDLRVHQRDAHELLGNKRKNRKTNNTPSMCITSTPRTSSCHVCRKTNVRMNLVEMSSGSEQVCDECSDSLSTSCFKTFEGLSPIHAKEIRCVHCSRMFDRHDLLEEHEHTCFARKQTYNENELIKPVIPNANSCLFQYNFTDERCSGDVLTFEEAQLTLQSLDVNCSRVEDAASKGKVDTDNSSRVVPEEEKMAAVVVGEAKSFHSPRGGMSSTPHSYRDSAQCELKSVDHENMPATDIILNGKENEAVVCTDDFRILNTFQVYQCIECKVNFDSKNSLHYHMSDVHEKTSEEKRVEDTGRGEIDKLLNDVECYQKNFDDSNGCVADDEVTDVIPSPNGSPVLDPIKFGIVHHLPKPLQQSSMKEKKCPFNCRSDTGRRSHPCGNCSVIESIKKCPVHKDHDADPYGKVNNGHTWKKPCRNWENGRETCKCCNVKFFNSPLSNPQTPKQKKYVFYPGEYPTALLRKYLPHPPACIPYAPVHHDMTSSYRAFHKPYQSSTIHHRPPYLFDGLMQYPENKLTAETRRSDPFNMSKLPQRNKTRKSKFVEAVDETKKAAPVSPASPLSSACDVNVVVDILKPLSPKSLDKSLQNGSRPKYSKSEVVLKMTRLADTLGRKFGARFKRTAGEFRKDLTQSLILSNEVDKI